MNPLRQVIEQDNKTWLVVQMPEEPSSSDFEMPFHIFKKNVKDWRDTCDELEFNYPPILCEGFKEGDRDLMEGRDYEVIEQGWFNEKWNFITIQEYEATHEAMRRIVAKPWVPILKEEEGDKEQSQWISVNDDLPELKQYVLIYTADRGFCPTHEMVTQYSKYGFAGASNVTHWMKLPPPPKQTTNPSLLNN